MKKRLALALLALMLLTTASAQEFSGTATGFGGPVTVTISVENGAIAACIITAEQETPSIGGQAAKTLEEIIAQTDCLRTYPRCCVSRTNKGESGPNRNPLPLRGFRFDCSLVCPSQNRRSMRLGPSFLRMFEGHQKRRCLS